MFFTNLSVLNANTKKLRTFETISNEQIFIVRKQICMQISFNSSCFVFNNLYKINSCFIIIIFCTYQENHVKYDYEIENSNRDISSVLNANRLIIDHAFSNNTAQRLQQTRTKKTKLIKTANTHQTISDNVYSDTCNCYPKFCNRIIQLNQLSIFNRIQPRDGTEGGRMVTGNAGSHSPD